MLRLRKRQRDVAELPCHAHDRQEQILPLHRCRLQSTQYLQ